jgi:hypothetical protein
MQVNKFDFLCDTNNICKIHVYIVYYGADNTVFESATPGWQNTITEPGKASSAPDARCTGSLLSTEFCAVADIETNLVLRD